jgi:calcineurin-like phosphoesterase family protein
MNIWLTSDWHLGHTRIINHCSRPFRDVHHMNEELVERHNTLVKPEDTVIDVGDFSMDAKYVEPFMKRLNGKRVLVAGNHDRCHPCHKGSENWALKYMEWGFKSVVTSLGMDIGGQRVLICHMPYTQDDRHGEKYAEYRPHDYGQPLLCGHVHQQWKQRGREINVGVDVREFAPVHIDEVAAIIARLDPPSEARG